MSRTALPAIGGIVQSLLTLPTSERTEAALSPMLRASCPTCFAATRRRGICFSASVEHRETSALICQGFYPVLSNLSPGLTLNVRTLVMADCASRLRSAASV